MTTGPGQGIAGRRKKTIGLIALTSEAGGVSVSYQIKDKISRRAKRQVANQLRKIADAVSG
jgi:hypothetical protein